MALYGSVPLMLALTPSGVTTGIFWLNAAESYIDIVHGDNVQLLSSSYAYKSPVLKGLRLCSVVSSDPLDERVRHHRRLLPAGSQAPRRVQAVCQLDWYVVRLHVCVGSCLI